MKETGFWEKTKNFFTAEKGEETEGTPPDYKVEFETTYKDSLGFWRPLLGKIIILDSKVTITCDSKAKVLPIDMISLIFASEAIVEKVKELHVARPGYRIIEITSEDEDGIVEVSWLYQESDPKTNKTGLSRKYKTVIEKDTFKIKKSNMYCGQIVDLYRIFLKYGKKFDVKFKAEKTEVYSEIKHPWIKPE